MIRVIENYNQHQQLIEEAKVKGCKASNLFMYSESIVDLIEKGKWKYILLDNGLLFLHDNDSFYRCYYYLNTDADYNNIVLDKDAVVEFPYNVKLRDIQTKQIDKLYELGFELGRESSEMVATSEGIKLTDIKDIVDFAANTDIDDIIKILNENFDQLYAFLPNEEELETLVLEKKIFVIRKDNNVVGVINTRTDGDFAIIDHLAIDEKYRGLGYGISLLQYFLNYYKGVKAYKHWVDINNIPAISIYTKMGYNLGVKKANEYIRRVEK